MILGKCALLRAFENKQFAEHIIENNYNDIHEDFCQPVVPGENVHQQPHACGIQREGKQARTHKGDQLPQHQLGRKTFASEHKDLIGEEGERDGEHPRERIGRQQLPLQDIPQQPKGKDIDRRGQGAEQNLQKHLWGSQEPPNFFQLFHMNPILFVCL